MKKVISIILALVMAMGMCTMAFAEDDTSTTKVYPCPGCGADLYSASELNTHMRECPYCNSTTRWEKTCPKCNRVFTDPKEYNNHLNSNGECAGTNGLLEGFSLLELINKIVETFDINSAQWEQIEDVVIRFIELVENVINNLMSASEADVAGAADDLENAVNGLGLVGSIKEYVSNIISAIKTKVLALYAHEVATEVETEAEAPADTGSSTAGIAAFTAISLACAAAFVCTKKKED